MNPTNPTAYLTNKSLAADIHTALEYLTKTEHDPIAINQSLVQIAKATGIGLKIIRQSFDIKLKQLNIKPVDVGLAIAKEVLEQTYEGGMSLKLTKDGQLYCFEKTHWVSLSESKVRADLQLVAVKYKQLTSKTLYGLVNDALGSLKDFLGSNLDVMSLTESPPPVINCLNGELWLCPDGEIDLRPHKPESRLRYCLPYGYEPEAKCPVFEDVMKEVFAHADEPDEMVRHAMELLGYAIQPRRMVPGFWMLIGHGANGKTSFLQTLCRLVSESYLHNITLSDFGKDKFSMSQLAGKLVMIDDDLKHGAVIQDGFLKTVSESKILSARLPYGKASFSFRNTALPIMAGNHYPLCNDSSPGLIRRAMVIPFDRQFLVHEQDESKFQHVWLNEMPGVLNLAITALQRLSKRGKFAEPKECVSARKEFLAHGNPLFCFLQECLVEKPGERVLLPAFRTAYSTWAKSQNISNLKDLDKTLKRRLQGLKYEIGLYNGYHCINGYSLSMPNLS